MTGNTKRAEELIPYTQENWPASPPGLRHPDG